MPPWTQKTATMDATANTVSAFSICKSLFSSSSSSWVPTLLPLPFIRFQNSTGIRTSFSSANSSLIFQRPSRTTRKSRSFTKAAAAAAEAEETLVPEGEADNTASTQGGDEASTTATDQTVSVPVSPSDMLTMFFQAEGTMNETAIPTVTKALEETEGISDLRVQVLEGIASVEVTKQTTIQATGVASNLVEIIQNKGFKLQTLNLSFQDEDDFSQM